MAPVRADATGDFLSPRSSEQFDAVHCFTVVRQTLTMYERALAVGGKAAPLPWYWNLKDNNNAPIQVPCEG